MFKVSRKLIQFILFPERHDKNLADRAARGGSKIYYDKDAHRLSMAKHRKKKKQALL
jgi:hypothetical protein